MTQEILFTIERILKVKNIRNVSVCSYSCENDFNKLWGFIKNSESPKWCENEKLTIIYSGYPEFETIIESNFKTWVSIHSWLVSMVAYCSLIKKLPPQVVILDLGLTERKSDLDPGGG